jgi:hypothetical protein
VSDAGRCGARRLRSDRVAFLWVALAMCGFSARLAAQNRTVANLVVGDDAVVVQAGPNKEVYIGVGTNTQTSTVKAPAAAVDEFVAEAEAIIRLEGRKIPSTTIDRPVLQEGAGGRALSVTRHLERQHGETQVGYHFFVSDSLSGYVVPATPDETKAVLLALHRAARVANAWKQDSTQTPSK